MPPSKRPNFSYLIPISVFILVIIIWRSYVFSNHTVQRPFPNVNLPTINQTKKQFSNQDLQGHVSLVNFWGSWCSVCRAEHPMLMKIKQQYHIPIYGILYDDMPSNAKELLEHAGNPYVLIAIDTEGKLANAMGIYGVPITFVVDSTGVVRYRHLGAITEKSWDNDILPVINKYKT